MTNSDGNKNCHLRFSSPPERRVAGGHSIETIPSLISNISIGSERKRIFGTKYPQTEIVSQLICPIWYGDLQGVVLGLWLFCCCTTGGTVVLWYCRLHQYNVSVNLNSAHLHPTVTYKYVMRAKHSLSSDVEESLLTLLGLSYCLTPLQFSSAQLSSRKNRITGPNSSHLTAR